MTQTGAEFGEFKAPHGVGAGLYRLFNRDGRLLYIGIGGCPAIRLKAHSKQKAWWPEVDRSKIQVEWFRTYGEAEVAEKEAIQTEDPLYNKKHSPNWQHYSTVRSARLAAERIATDEIPLNLAGSNINDLVAAVRGARRCVFIMKNGHRAAAAVPPSLGELVQRLGGVDVAEAILGEALGDPPEM